MIRHEQQQEAKIIKDGNNVRTNLYQSRTDSTTEHKFDCSVVVIKGIVQII